MQERPSIPSRPSTVLWRGRLRFSVRSLMVHVVLLAVALGWYMYQVRVQHEAVATIQRTGAWVIYSWQWRNGSFKRFGKPRVPGSLLRWLGHDFFYSVKRVDIDADFGQRADDDLMTRVGWLRDLEVLSLHGNKDVTDIGLAHLKGLERLRFLYLSGTGVTDAGLKHLKNMKKLEGLSLENTRATSTGVEELRRELDQHPPRARISHGPAVDW
jgi:hypothetical protein